MNRRIGWLVAAALSSGCASGTRPGESPKPQPIVRTTDGMVLSDADVRSVLEIAHCLGLTDIDEVHGGKVRLPSGPLGVRVRETIVTEPTVLHRRVLRIGRVGETRFEPSGDDVVTVGGWESSSADILEFELRRVFVDEWHADLRLEDGVSYETAVRLITAIRRGEVELSDETREQSITSVGRVQFLPIPQGHDEAGKHDVFQVTTSIGGAGKELMLCIEGSKVVLIEERFWIV